MELALWNAWLQRAVRLLADQPECVEMGYLETALVRSSFDRGAVDEAREHATRAQGIGARFDDRDLVAFGQVMQGAALVFSGEVERGLGLVDEGTLAAVGGELTPYAAGSIYCITINRVPFGRGLPASRTSGPPRNRMVRTSVDHRVPRRVSCAARRDHAPARASSPRPRTRRARRRPN